MIMNQLLFGFAGRGVSTWRGQQYSLALFPIWIRGTTSALANVLFHRPLDFVVTPKTRQAVNQWRFIRPQMVVGVILIIGLVIGATRLIMGMAEPIGTLVNIAWVLVDLAMLSVLVPAARYRGFEVKGQSN
jgi:cellulose synthase (UDP-forming)